LLEKSRSDVVVIVVLDVVNEAASTRGALIVPSMVLEATPALPSDARLLTSSDFFLYIHPPIAIQHPSSCFYIISQFASLEIHPFQYPSQHPLQNNHVDLRVAPPAYADSGRSSHATRSCTSLKSGTS
jgi:hypothetical protein